MTKFDIRRKAYVKKLVVSILCVMCCVFAVALMSGCNDGSAHVHSFTQKSTDDEYLKSSANSSGKAVYYYSCECGERGAETFEVDTELSKQEHFVILFANDEVVLTGLKGNCDEDDLKIPAGVTSIDKSAFEGYTTLKSIKIPESVTNIGESAFKGCTNLEEVFWNAKNCVMAGSEAAPIFEGCGITSISIGENTRRIPAYAFLGCANVESITLPQNITTIGDSAFKGCSGLKTVNWDSEYCVTAGKKDHTIFENCTNLTSVEFKPYVDVIPAYAFYNCNLLTKVVIPEDTTSIGNYAFYGCSKISSLELSSKLLTVGDYAFAGCSAITSLNFQKDVKEICEGAFSDCSAITSISMQNKIESLGDSAFSGCSQIKEITLPESLTSIGGSAFKNCTSLSKITMPKTASYLGGGAFDGCSAITGLTVPEGISYIYALTFNGCSKLETITLPKSLKKIDGLILSKNFDGCDVLANIYYTGNVDEWSQIDGLNWLLNSGLHQNFCEKTLYIDNMAINEIEFKNITSIKNYAFAGLKQLKKVTLGKSVTHVGENAFENCSNLTNFTITESLLSVGESALDGCNITFNTDKYNRGSYLGVPGNQYYLLLKANSQIDDYYVNEDTVIISDYAFHYSKIERITFTGNVKRIGDNAFACSFELSTVNLHKARALEYIGNSAFDSCISLGSIILPDSVKYLGEKAFKNCERLTSITLSKSLKSIENNTFELCGWLNEIKIPEGVERIGDSAFLNCVSFRSVELPLSLKSIGDYAFYVDKLLGNRVILQLRYNGTYEQWQKVEHQQNSLGNISRGYCTRLTTKD